MKVLFPPHQQSIDTGYANFDFDVQYLQSAVFSFEKRLNHQNHFLQLFGKLCG